MASKLGDCSNNNHHSINNCDININKKVEEKLKKWRKHFKGLNSDIFEVIENAIMVAAMDYPKKFRVRKSEIAELLFSCRLTQCSSCDRVNHGDDQFDDCGSKGSKVSSNGTKDVDFDIDVDNGGGGGGGGDDVDIGGNEGGEVELIDSVVDPSSSNNVSYEDVEALNDLIEQEKEVIIEVLRIKDILYNSQDESDSVLFESLRRLQLMHLTINILQETEIGKAVNHIKRHSSKDIRHLARSLIVEWKNLVDQWVKSTQELAEGGTPDSVNPSTVDEEEGLPSPPMDEGVFFTTQTMDFNQFFDGMDDDGNLRNCGEFNKNRDSGRKPSASKPQTRTQKPSPEPSKPTNSQPSNAKPLIKANGDVKLSKDLKYQPKLENPVVQRRPAPQSEKPRPSNEDSVQVKLEAAKRKLHERYQQAENAKRQRTIQVMEIQDLPKQGLVNRNPHSKFGNHNRHWANGRK